MTIAQLKRHMDRRFDHLERTKVDKTDLLRFATKRDLDRFVTKQESRRFATKRDLRRFATKSDLARYAARNEALAVDTRRYFDIVAESLSDDIRKVADVIDEVKHLSSVMSEHESRISDLERGAR